MKNVTIRKMLAVVGLAAALTGCGEANSTSTPVSEETLQDEPGSSTEESKDETSSEDDAEDEKQDDAGETSEPDAGDEEASKDDAALEDASYYTNCMPIVYPDGACEEPFFNEVYTAEDNINVLYRAEISGNVLTITASFIQQDADCKKMTFETREIPVAEDLKIWLFEEGEEEISVEKFNSLYADPEGISIEKFNTLYAIPQCDDSWRGVGIEMKVENGEAKVLYINPLIDPDRDPTLHD